MKKTRLDVEKRVEGWIVYFDPTAGKDRMKEEQLELEEGENMTQVRKGSQLAAAVKWDTAVKKNQ